MAQQVKESACQCRRHGFDPWVGRIPWRRAWQPIPVILLGKSPGKRSHPWSCKELDTTEATEHRSLFYSMEVTLSGVLGGFRMGLATRYIQPWSESLEKGKGAGDWVNDWSGLCDEASIKIPKVCCSKSFWMVNIFVNRKATHPNSTDIHGWPSRLDLMPLFIWLFIWVFIITFIIVNW